MAQKNDEPWAAGGSLTEFAVADDAVAILAFQLGDELRYTRRRQPHLRQLLEAALQLLRVDHAVAVGVEAAEAIEQVDLLLLKHQEGQLRQRLGRRGRRRGDAGLGGLDLVHLLLRLLGLLELVPQRRLQRGALRLRLLQRLRLAALRGAGRAGLDDGAQVAGGGAGGGEPVAGDADVLPLLVGGLGLRLRLGLGLRQLLLALLLALGLGGRRRPRGLVAPRRQRGAVLLAPALLRAGRRVAELLGAAPRLALLPALGPQPVLPRARGLDGRRLPDQRQLLDRHGPRALAPEVDAHGALAALAVVVRLDGLHHALAQPLERAVRHQVAALQRAAHECRSAAAPLALAP